MRQAAICQIEILVIYLLEEYLQGSVLTNREKGADLLLLYLFMLQFNQGAVVTSWLLYQNSLHLLTS